MRCCGVWPCPLVVALVLNCGRGFVFHLPDPLSCLWFLVVVVVVIVALSPTFVTLSIGSGPWLWLWLWSWPCLSHAWPFVLSLVLCRGCGCDLPHVCYFLYLYVYIIYISLSVMLVEPVIFDTSHTYHSHVPILLTRSFPLIFHYFPLSLFERLYDHLLLTPLNSLLYPLRSTFLPPCRPFVSISLSPPRNQHGTTLTCT